VVCAATEYDAAEQQIAARREDFGGSFVLLASRASVNHLHRARVTGDGTGLAIGQDFHRVSGKKARCAHRHPVALKIRL
jgi:hypothetical protein